MEGLWDDIHNVTRQTSQRLEDLLNRQKLDDLLVKKHDIFRKAWPWDFNQPRADDDLWLARTGRTTPSWSWLTMTTTTTTTTPQVPLVWNWNTVPTRKVEVDWGSTTKETDYSGKTIITFFIVLAVGIFILIYALNCIKDCREWKNDVLRRRTTSYSSPTRSRAAQRHPNARNEVVIEVPVDRPTQWTRLPEAPPTFHIVTLVPASLHTTPTRHLEAPPPSYERATDIINEPPKYEDCVR